MRRLALGAALTSLLFAAPMAACAAGAPAAHRSGGATSPSELARTEFAVPQALVTSPSGAVRGPSAAALPDGRVLLGGGPNGRQLLLFDPAEPVDPTDPTRSATALVGEVIRADQRLDDARFAPTDIEVMSSDGDRVRVFIAYPELVASRNCLRLAIDRLDLSTGPQPAILDRAKVLRSSPCVPPGAIQHASGKLVRVSATKAYVTLGDLGYPGIDNRRTRGQLGSVLLVAEGRRAVRISQGHRNGQGLTLDRRGQLWETEHGPQGGDELNLIRRGRDYGWPFVTLGQPYGTNDYVMPKRTRTHKGFTRPRTSWVPSVATSEIVQVPAAWPGWSSALGGDLLMGTLRDQALWRIRVDRANRVIDRVRIPFGHRVRDLEVRADGSVLATTDSAMIIVMTPK